MFVCRFATNCTHAAIVCLSRGRRDRGGQRSDAVRGACVLQRPERSGGHCGGCGSGQRHRRPFPVNLLQADFAAGHAHPVAGLRPGHRPVRVPRYGGHRLRRVVPETGETVRGGPVEVRERHVRRPDLRRVRHRTTQRHQRSVTFLRV